MLNKLFVTAGWCNEGRKRRGEEQSRGSRGQGGEERLREALRGERRRVRRGGGEGGAGEERFRGEGGGGEERRGEVEVEERAGKERYRGERGGGRVGERLRRGWRGER